MDDLLFEDNLSLNLSPEDGSDSSAANFSAQS